MELGRLAGLSGRLIQQQEEPTKSETSEGMGVYRCIHFSGTAADVRLAWQRLCEFAKHVCVEVRGVMHENITRIEAMGKTAVIKE